MTTRELKVSELNHILPIVRETLEKEEELRKLREMASHNESNNCKKQIKELEDFIATSKLLFEGFSQMFIHDLLNCYQTGGVLEVSELKEDYIYEYAYLIQNIPSLTIYRLISMRPEVKHKVESNFKKVPSSHSRKKIRNYLRLAIRYDKEL